MLGQSTIRTEVIEALVRQGAPVVPQLIEQLRMEDAETRLAAIVALGRLADRRATEALVGLLGRDRDLTVAAAGALAELGIRRRSSPCFDCSATRTLPCARPPSAL